MFHFLRGETETTHISGIISTGAAARLSDRGFLEKEIGSWVNSPKRKAQITGEKYYNGEQAILRQKRMAIGQDGQLVEVHNLPNSRIVDNQYAKMVDQKVNYLLGNPPTFDTESDTYSAALNQVFGKEFYRTLRILAEDSLNGGIGWLMPFYGETGELQFRRFEPYEILPFWKDAAHTVLDAAVHLYEVETYEGNEKRIVQHIEAMTPDGVYYFVREHGTLIPEAPYHAPYVLTGEGVPLNWSRIPLIAWKYNAKEIPLIRRVKALQDGINLLESNFENNMLEDPRNTILVVVNYDGTSLGEFRRNLAVYGAVSVRNDSESPRGSVETLTVEVSAENYQAILKLFKQALTENARGYDAKDERLSGNPNQMNILSMYSDIDLDANGMESEYQASFEQLLWFVRAHLANTGSGDFEGIPVTVTFNRDVMMNTAELIQQCRDSVGLVSDRTILAHHPFVDDVNAELDLLEEQEQTEMRDVYSFPQGEKREER